MLHTPTFESFTTRTGTPLWHWVCECGAPAKIARYSKTEAMIDHAEHAYPNHPPPSDHTPTYTLDKIGATNWVCDCGWTSRAGGHMEPHRARQAHTRHRQAALLKWYDHRRSVEETRALRDISDQKRMARSSPEACAALAQRQLEEIL